MKKKLLAMVLAGAMSVAVLTGCSDDTAATTVDTVEAAADEVVEDAAEEVEEAADEVAEDVEEAAEEVAEDVEEASDITFVDGFYANDGNGSDFIIAFYEGAAGDVAYVNDGTNEAIAEYVVENATLDDGTEYLLVTVGQTQIGYIEDGDDLYLVDDEGNIYAAGRLTEAEADEIYNALQ